MSYNLFFYIVTNKSERFDYQISNCPANNQDLPVIVTILHIILT